MPSRQDKRDSAITAIEAGLREDPSNHRFILKVVDWLKKLEPSPSEALLLAAWGHTLYRWRIPREKYPMTTRAYHQWRNAQSRLSADEMEKMMRELDYDPATIGPVRELILKTTFPQDPDSRVLEDADCLAFLELKFENYLAQWDEAKIIRILKGTLEKMTPQARKLALTIPYSDAAKGLIERGFSGLAPDLV